MLTAWHRCVKQQVGMVLQQKWRLVCVMMSNGRFGGVSMSTVGCTIKFKYSSRYVFEYIFD